MRTIRELKSAYKSLFCYIKTLKIFKQNIYEPIDRDIIHATECLLNDDENFDLAIRPAFDSLANAFGMEESPNYNNLGEYVIRK